MILPTSCIFLQKHRKIQVGFNIMKSMTGYGYKEISGVTGAIFKAEIRSVNRKQFDLKVSLPPDFSEHELVVRKFLSEKISRGSINVNILLSFSEELLKKSVRINHALLKAYLENAESLSKEFHISSSFTLNDLYNLPNVIEIVNPAMISEQVKLDIIAVLEKAFLNFDKTRKEEGEFLKRNFIEKLKLLADILSKIEPLTTQLPKIYSEKLKERVQNLGVNIADENAIHREIVLYSDKCDVSEEITRLKSHFKQFETLINDNSAVGRNLDFLIQEMQREINTLGVKAASTEISPLIVQFKTELEKVREQIQNIE